jgi:hypothetical protein
LRISVSAGQQRRWRISLPQSGCGPGKCEREYARYPANKRKGEQFFHVSEDFRDRTFIPSRNREFRVLFRSIQELPLAGITGREEANRFLRERYMGEFNTRFTVKPAQRGSALRRCGRSEREVRDLLSGTNRGLFPFTSIFIFLFSPE